MLGNMHRNKSVNVHQFAMVPKPEIPRSRFKKPYAHKTTFNAAALIPIYLDEVLPGDTHDLTATMFARLSTPVFPVMDNMYLETFWFFVPMRLVWLHYDKFFGAQENPADSTSFAIPTITSAVGGYALGSIFDYFGLPTAGQVVAGNTYLHSALPLRAYNLIWNLWFRDENLQNSVGYGSANGTSQWTNMDDGPDPANNYTLQLRGKRHDYFTSCLPWTQKGGQVQLPLTGNATVKTAIADLYTGTQTPVSMLVAATGATPTLDLLVGTGEGGGSLNKQLSSYSTSTGSGTNTPLYFSNLYADLSTVTATTINSLRLAFATQKVLERDARGGTRYQEKIFAHFGVMGTDARLMKPEYLGGSKQAINIQPVPQTGPTGTTGSTSPMGTLAAIGHITTQARWKQSFTEHGYIIGLASANCDLNYQQGLRKLWSRSTQYDFYLPAFAHLGEQAVLNKEIFTDGSANDPLVFGYQERWGEMRYMPSNITGFFRSTAATPLDTWHFAEKFAALPALNATFIQSSSQAVVQRAIAAGAAGNNQQLIFDLYVDNNCTRLLPLYSVPGFIDRF